MTAKKYAISDPSAEIALRYGKNVSRGILVMSARITELEMIVNDYYEESIGR